MPLRNRQPYQEGITGGPRLVRGNWLVVQSPREICFSLDAMSPIQPERMRKPLEASWPGHMNSPVHRRLPGCLCLRRSTNPDPSGLGTRAAYHRRNIARVDLVVRIWKQVQMQSKQTTRAGTCLRYLRHVPAELGAYVTMQASRGGANTPKAGACLARKSPASVWASPPYMVDGQYAMSGCILSRRSCAT